MDAQIQPLPALPDKAPGLNGYTYKPRFGIVIPCDDEENHKEVYENLVAQGYKCKVVRI